MERETNDNVGGADPGGNPALDLPAGDPRPGAYRHYKGGMYQVLGLVRHSESLQVMVLYRALYGAQGLWVRPRAMFLESVLIGDVAQARFAWVSDPIEPAACKVWDNGGLAHASGIEKSQEKPDPCA